MIPIDRFAASVDGAGGARAASQNCCHWHPAWCLKQTPIPGKKLRVLKQKRDSVSLLLA
jgi:hypothetical protein